LRSENASKTPATVCNTVHRFTRRLITSLLTERLPLVKRAVTSKTRTEGSETFLICRRWCRDIPVWTAGGQGRLFQKNIYSAGESLRARNSGWFVMPRPIRQRHVWNRGQGSPLQYSCSPGRGKTPNTKKTGQLWVPREALVRIGQLRL